MTYSDGSIFSRQMLVPGFGQRGQDQLKASRVLIIGMGGLGCPAALYLAAMGVTLGIVDGDVVEMSNLPRQILYSVLDVGSFKIEAAQRTLERAYPYSIVTAHATYVNAENVHGLIRGYDVVINGVDNYATRMLVNHACMMQNIPWIDGGAVGMTGYIGAFSRNTGCYECLFPAVPSDALALTCQATGILPPVVGMIGTQLALQAIAILTGVGKTLWGCLVAFDASSYESSQLFWNPNPDCWCQQLPKPLQQSDSKAALGNIEVSVLEAWRQLVAGTAVLWDVRNDQAPEMFRIIGAELHPEILDGEFHGPRPTLPVNVICALGLRSDVATGNLRTLGIEARNVKGGIKAWRKYGLPICNTTDICEG